MIQSGFYFSVRHGLNSNTSVLFDPYLLKMESKSLISAAIITDIINPLAPILNEKYELILLNY